MSVRLSAGLVAVCALSGPPSSDLDVRFHDLIVARYEAMARADTATVHRAITDDLDWVVGASGQTLHTKDFLAAISHLQTPPPRYTIDSVHARALGGTATVTYRRTDRRGGGDFELAWTTVALEVFVQRAGRWVLAQHSQTWVVTSPAPLHLDSAALAAFVGHYEIGPGFVDNVHWEGQGLVATATGESGGAHLVPVSSSAFSPDGVAPLMVFERDASGRVVGYVQGSPDGSVRRARKVAP